MAQKKKKFTRHQIAKKVGIQPYIMEAWKQQFNIEPTVNNGEEIYSRQQLSTFKAIKELLYEKGFSMDAAKKYLDDKPNQRETKSMAELPYLVSKNDALESYIGVVPAQTTSVSESLDNHKKERTPIANKAQKKDFNKELTNKLLNIKEQLVKLSGRL